MATWPVTIPQLPLEAGYAETPPDLVIRSQVDQGPAKVRLRYTSGPRTFKFAVEMTKTELATFDSFFTSDCTYGTTSFTWTHPRTGSSATFRFVGVPQYSNAEGDNITVSFTAEILP